MDIVDEYILDQLKKDSRTPFLKIAKSLKVSEGTVRKRVAKLLDKEIIQRFTIDVNYDFSAVVAIKLEPNAEMNAIAQEIRSRHIDRVMIVTGRYDLICILGVGNIHTLNQTIEKIRSIKGIQFTETFTVLSGE
jgi:DNA-binding Lrp family transcriptional regulator